MRIKIRKADKIFSQYIRTRDNWTCQRCGKVYTPPTSGLHCAHMFSRGHESTRFDPDNACALCYGCHAYIDSHPIEKIEFFKKRLGRNFATLHMKSNTPGKKDDAMQILIFTNLLKELE